ncbi:hypothetical protein FISHEDRAFT_72148 [Fistulina hepatica ATCC 64428]|uniref:Nitrogen regulatory protein areA GATA-like domain-containing protein n=1 Tax=Fistulina hepatica ATCC 64428 TaxID=1128425 RepID=A0A0D7AF11_9AGAR|nr:hypothetical protein FISHEDRAFT_72148 [Fistulina hepatica ATCC 64428]
MANYLPVLLVSLANNSAIDDSSVSTQPRGQVDYLSHEWLEEDVWKSWRNMTKQKKEIANGMRLENASWRTWWKQRNGLKTVSPETLNWLKDSDVTWLYGPLHTAVDWNPSPHSKPILQSVDDRDEATAHDRLNLNSTMKPILKHRTISEMLTSDLPSPVFSPQGSESESDGEAQASRHLSPVPEEPGSAPSRPPLPHSKSDTHIVRWGPNRNFRKDSPPRVDPPSHVVPSDPPQHAHHRPHAGDGKKRHISFNTFVEQCIAIDKPSESPLDSLRVNSSGDIHASASAWHTRSSTGRGHQWFDPDDGYVEDEEDEDEDDGVWTNNECAIGSDSESDDEFDDDGIIEMRSSVHRQPPAKKRSKSKLSNSSTSSSSTSTSNGSTSSRSRSKRQRQDRLQPGLLRAGASRSRSTSTGDEPHQQHHVTIAPIAPTMLKVGSERESLQNSWMEGFGDDLNHSDDGIYLPNKVHKRRSIDDRHHPASDTPVELVYVPPSGSMYTHNVTESTYDIRSGQLDSSFGGGDSRDVVEDVREDHGTDGTDTEFHVRGDYFVSGDSSRFQTSESHSPYAPGRSLPVVVRTPPIQQSFDDDIENIEDFGEQDSVFEDDEPPPSRFHLRRDSFDIPRESVKRVREIIRSGRNPSRSNSGSRSLSPRISSPITSPLLDKSDVASSPREVPTATRGPSGGLLSPPGRGRSVQQEPPPARGRSATRTSSSLSDRERSSHSSPIGSLSPDDTVVRTYGPGVYTNGRIPGRERGRDRTGRSLSHSLSPDLSAAKPGSPLANSSTTPSLLDSVVTSVFPLSNSASSSPATSASSAASVAEDASADGNASTVMSSSFSSHGSEATIVPDQLPSVASAMKVDTTAVQASGSSLSEQAPGSKPSHEPEVPPEPAASALEGPSSPSGITKSRPMPNGHLPHHRSPSFTLQGRAPGKSPPSVSTNTCPPSKDEPSGVVAPSLEEPFRLGHKVTSSIESLQQSAAHTQDISVVEKAKDFVSSAGAFFGLWNGGHSS